MNEGSVGLLLYPALMSSAPMILTLVALVDAVRTGADWQWYVIIVVMPLLGPLFYFRSGRGAGFVSHQASSRAVARRTIREKEPQLAHWRGAGPLTESGEALLTLGRYAEAEAHLREALSVKGRVEDVNFALAQAIESQGRPAEAVPLLAELVAKEPDHRFGQAAVALARCLDESGSKAEAEEALRKILERRPSFEARVRLARLLVQKGNVAEAHALLDLVRQEGRALPRYAKRLNGPWIRAAARVRRGGTRLPGIQKPGVSDPRAKAAIAVAVVGSLVVGAIAFARMRQMLELASPGGQLSLQRQAIAGLDRVFPRTVSPITDDDVGRYVRVRRALGVIATAPDPTFLGVARGALAAERMGPAELGMLAGACEVQILRRSELSGSLRPGPPLDDAVRAMLERHRPELEQESAAGVARLLGA
ncbi:MAG: tetratricopeptide repeat protein [Acidobacteriota bacterium]